MATNESWFSRFLSEFREKRYESEFTQFMRELKQQRPQLEEEQKKSRTIWWDKRQDPDALERQRESRVEQQAYVYQNKV